MRSKIHVTVIGAGAVGVAAAVSILHGRVASRLTLFDALADKARGEALDLAHAAPLFGGALVEGGGHDEIRGGDLCIVTAGAKQRPGEDRLSLLARNEKALDDITETLAKNPLPKAVLVVTNPVDVMTEAMRRRLAPRGVRVLGSGTLLDTLRLRHALSRTLEISPESIHASVVGEHGDSSVCLLDSGRAGGLPLADAFREKGLVLDDERRDALAAEVRGAAYQIIARKGATSHAIGVAVARIARAIVNDERVVLPVSAPIDATTCAGIPCVLGAEGAAPLSLSSLSAREQAEVDRSIAILRQRCSELRVA